MAAALHVPGFARAFRIAALLASTVVAFTPDAPAQTTHWIGTWAAAPAGVESPSDLARYDQAGGTTLRQIVHVSIGGDTTRVIFTNEFGTDPLTIAAARIARRADGASVFPAGSAALTFAGHPSITVPADALVVSDPVPFKFPL